MLDTLFKEAWRGKKLSHNAKMWRNVELYHSACRYIRLFCTSICHGGIVISVLVFILQSVVAVCDFVILVFECLIPRRRGVNIQFDRPLIK